MESLIKQSNKEAVCQYDHEGNLGLSGNCCL